MSITFQKWGNSLAVRIPADVAKKLGLEPGSKAEVEARDGKLVFDLETETARKVPKISLNWLLEGMTREDFDDHIDRAWVNAPPRGREIV
jgi:antitoxin MazE